jgi:putative oxidoreductase
MMSNLPGKNRDYGLLLLRVGIGITFVFVHGLPKIIAGAQMWTSLGGAFNRLIGIAFYPAFWGFMASVSEFGGGICLALGILFRPACALIGFTMLIAVASILRGGYGFSAASQPCELGIIFFSLILSGSGRYTLPTLIASIKTAR